MTKSSSKTIRISHSNRMSPEELQAYMHHKKSGHVHQSHNTYKRKPKHRNRDKYDY